MQALGGYVGIMWTKALSAGEGLAGDYSQNQKELDY